MNLISMIDLMCMYYCVRTENDRFPCSLIHFFLLFALKFCRTLINLFRVTYLSHQLGGRGIKESFGIKAYH